MPARYSRWRPEVYAVDTRKTFVLWIAREGGAGDPNALAGRLEEVDTGVEVRFRSAEQLIAFLRESVSTDQEGSND